MYDALGNEIVFGERYAVSERCAGGLVATNIGIAVKTTPGGKVTLQAERGIVHNGTLVHTTAKKPTKYSVLPGLLFRIKD